MPHCCICWLPGENAIFVLDFANNDAVANALVCRVQTHDRKDIRLFYGTKNTDTTAYSDLDGSWKAAGVETTHVYSDDDKGYVQDVFSKVRFCHWSVTTLALPGLVCLIRVLVLTLACTLS